MNGQAAIARQRREAAKAVDLGVDAMMRAAVCLDTAITHARASDLPTDGCRLTLAAMIDVLRDQIDAGTQEHRFLEGLAVEAERRANEVAA